MIIAGAVIGGVIGYGIQAYHNHQQGGLSVMQALDPRRANWSLVGQAAFQGAVSGAVAGVVSYFLPVSGAMGLGQRVAATAGVEFSSGRAEQIGVNLVSGQRWNDDLWEPEEGSWWGQVALDVLPGVGATVLKPALKGIKSGIGAGLDRWRITQRLDDYVTTGTPVNPYNRLKAKFESIKPLASLRAKGSISNVADRWRLTKRLDDYVTRDKPVNLGNRIKTNIITKLWDQSVWRKVWLWGHPNTRRAVKSEVGFIRRMFNGDRELYNTFLKTLNDELPEGVTVYAKGSGITGYKWTTGGLFDSRGLGTSDLDLILVGDNATDLWENPEGCHFNILGKNTGILGAETPEPLTREDVAPALIPLWEKITAIVGRPVNFQGTSEGYLRRRLWIQRTKYLEILQK